MKPENPVKPPVDQPLPILHFRPEQTAIVKDMQDTARQIQIVDLLLEHQRLINHYPAHCYNLVEEVLIRLGVSNTELLRNLHLEKGIGEPT